LNLRPETEPDHLRYVLSEIRRVLYSHAKVETETVRVRLVDVVSSSYAIEIFCYILTRDFNEFAAVREDIFLHMIGVVGESGTGFALPSQTLYLGRDSGLEKEKTQNAVKKIAELRDGKQLPFPDFAEKEISSFRGSIDYPQPESALRNEKPGSEPKR
jgi:MscS family membrane protein